MSDQRIEEIKHRKAELERELQQLEEEQKVRQELTVREEHGVRIVCENCEGTGSVTMGGADIISDPPWEESCENCHGLGFAFCCRWTEKRRYSEELQHLRGFWT